MRDTFVKTLCSVCETNKDVELITADLGFGVLKPFFEQFPDQFTNAGIAEQNMTSVAAGMAREGKTVFTYSIGNFPTLRCLEQIRNDCAYHNANVKIVCVGGGFVYGSLGMSHHATEDISVMRSIPNVAVFCPGDAIETAAITKAIANYPGTCYLRLGRGGEKPIHKSIENFQIGKAIPVKEGRYVAILTTGAIYEEIDKALAILAESGITPSVYSFPTVKPIDKETIKKCAETHTLIVTCEENNIMGGFGSAVSEVMADNGLNSRLIRIGIDDTFCDVVGDQTYLREIYGMSGKKIAEKIIEAMK
jgi:transketolase